MAHRAVRQLTLGIVPLLVIGVALLVVLFVREQQVAGGVDATTARAQGTVTSVERHGDPRHATVAWTDRDGTGRRSRIAFPASDPPPKGAHLTVHYRPGADRVFVAGDVTYHRIEALAGGVFYVLVVLGAAAAVTAARILLRRRAARRPATATRISRVQTRFQLIRRSVLVVTDEGREWWLPVYWDPVLTDLLSDTPARLHGRIGRGVVAIDIGGVLLWPSGRPRARQPRGDLQENPGTWSKSAAQRRTTAPEQVPLTRQARSDAVFVMAAPFLGLLWAYVNGAGPVGFAVATVLLAGVLFWVPSIYGSDPT